MNVRNAWRLVLRARVDPEARTISGTASSPFSPVSLPQQGQVQKGPVRLCRVVLDGPQALFPSRIRLWRASSRGCGQRARYSSNLCGDANFHGSGACYRDWPRYRLHSPSAERMAENAPVTPSARSVQTQKKIPLELTILPPTSPAPLMWRARTPNAPSDPRSMMTWPDRRSASTSVPYSQMTRLRPPPRPETVP